MKRFTDFIITAETDCFCSSAKEYNTENKTAMQKFNSLNAFPCQIRDAWRLGADVSVYPNFNCRDFNKILVIGVGESRLSGLLMKKYAEKFSSVPVFLTEDYPKVAVDGHTLAVFVSYSGNSTETVACYKEIKRQNAVCAVVTGGGRLWQTATANKDLLITVPQNSSPWEATAYLTIPPFLLAGKFGLWNICTAELLEILEAVNDVIFCCNQFVPEKENHAKQLATKIQGKIPVILGVEGCMEAVALSWKNLLGQNAEYTGYSGTVSGTDNGRIQCLSARNIVILLRSVCEGNAVKKRVAALEKSFKQNNIQCETVCLTGKNTLAKAYAMLVFGGYVSLYLAENHSGNKSQPPLLTERKNLV